MVAVRALAAVANALSDRTADRFGSALGAFVGRILTSRRRVALENLHHALGDHFSASEIEAIADRVFRNIGRTAFEVARFPQLTPEHLNSIVVESGRTLLDRVRDDGRGGLLLSAHFGNWELLGAWAAAQGYPIDFLVLEQHNPLFDRYINNLRHSIGVGVHYVPRETKAVLRGLKAGRMMAILIDQHDPARTQIVDFFGRPAATPQGAAALAVRAECPIVRFVMRRDRFDRHVMMHEETLFPDITAERDAEVRRLTVECVRFYERQISAWPDQWLWTHRRWKVADGNFRGDAAVPERTR